MIIIRFVAASAAVLAPHLAAAQGFSGAELSAGMLAYTEDTNLGASSYAGSLEFGLFAGIGVGADIARHTWRGEEGNSTSYTLHGMYEVTPDATAGLFVGQDRRDLGETDVYGIEGATSISGIGIEGFVGRYDGDLGTGTMLGLNGAFAFTDALSATAAAGVVNGEGATMNTVSLGGEYSFGSGPIVYAEVGQQDLGDDPATFISLGARIELGQGTTFGGRGLTDLLPGF